jgi:tetratricopeptide (TPR) repeat protein
MKKAIEYFKQAIKEDPNYALAYVGIADANDIIGETDSSAIPLSKVAISKALEMDDSIAEAYTTLAGQKFHYNWDWTGAEREFKRALELNPNYATAHHWYSEFLMTQQRVEESIEEMKLALELDPLSLAINRDLGEIFYYARQYDQAIEALDRTLEMDSRFILTHFWFGLSYLQKSMYEEALTEFQKELDLSGKEDAIALIGITYVKIGKKSEAEQLLEKLKQSSVPNAHYYTALLFYSLGEYEKCFEWLNKAYEGNAPWLHFLKVDPLADSIRSDPRFETMLRKMGLDDE